MKAYFEDILKKGVPTCSRCSEGKKSRNTAASIGVGAGTPEENVRCSRCSQRKRQTYDHGMFFSGTPGTLSNLLGVPQKVRETAAAHLEHLRTPEIDNIQYYYTERAAILEYDGRFPREEAERLAFKDGLIQYVNEAYPAIEQEYHMIIYPTQGATDDAAK